LAYQIISFHIGRSAATDRLFFVYDLLPLVGSRLAAFAKTPATSWPSTMTVPVFFSSASAILSSAIAILSSFHILIVPPFFRISRTRLSFYGVTGLYIGRSPAL